MDSRIVKFSNNVSDVSWSNFETAYGNAGNVETQLKRLASPTSKIAMKAAHDLWCGLCHQHAYISSAALPALPFLIDAYLQSGDKLKVGLLDIFLGFAVCLKRSESHQSWEVDLLKSLQEHLHLFETAAASQNENISSFADEILLKLSSTP